jgi:hypothetical protein
MSVASQCLYYQTPVPGMSGSLRHAIAPAISYCSYSIAEAKSSARIHPENIESGPKRQQASRHPVTGLSTGYLQVALELEAKREHVLSYQLSMPVRSAVRTNERARESNSKELTRNTETCSEKGWL